MKNLEKLIKFSFKNQRLFREALTHKSYAIEANKKKFNERLEFLGDSVLSLSVSSYLFKKYPKIDEGELSRLRSAIVSGESLTVWARDIKLGDYLFLSRGEDVTGGRSRGSTLADALEALIGAIYLDSGYAAAEKFVLNRLKRRKFLRLDYKSQLQEIIQKKYKIPPRYSLVNETGPDHNKTFQIEVWVGEKSFGCGAGKTKKQAEQLAAGAALEKLKTTINEGEE